MLLLATFDYREIYKTNGLRYLNRVFKFQNFEKESKFGTMQLLLHVTTVANSVVYFCFFFLILSQKHTRTIARVLQ